MIVKIRPKKKKNAWEDRFVLEHMRDFMLRTLLDVADVEVEGGVFSISFQEPAGMPSEALSNLQKLQWGQLQDFLEEYDFELADEPGVAAQASP